MLPSSNSFFFTIQHISIFHTRSWYTWKNWWWNGYLGWAAWGWDARTSGDGIIPILEQAICALHSILKEYHEKFLDNSFMGCAVRIRQFLWQRPNAYGCQGQQWIRGRWGYQFGSPPPSMCDHIWDVNVDITSCALHDTAVVNHLVQSAAPQTSTRSHGTQEKTSAQPDWDW